MEDGGQTGVEGKMQTISSIVKESAPQTCDTDFLNLLDNLDNYLHQVKQICNTSSSPNIYWAPSEYTESPQTTQEVVVSSGCQKNCSTKTAHSENNSVFEISNDQKNQKHTNIKGGKSDRKFVNDEGKKRKRRKLDPSGCSEERNVDSDDKISKNSSQEFSSKNSNPCSSLRSQENIAKQRVSLVSKQSVGDNFCTSNLSKTCQNQQILPSSPQGFPTPITLSSVGCNSTSMTYSSKPSNSLPKNTNKSLPQTHKNESSSQKLLMSSAHFSAMDKYNSMKTNNSSKTSNSLSKNITQNIRFDESMNTSSTSQSSSPEVWKDSSPDDIEEKRDNRNLEHYILDLLRDIKSPFKLNTQSSVNDISFSSQFEPDSDLDDMTEENVDGDSTLFSSDSDFSDDKIMDDFDKIKCGHKLDDYIFSMLNNKKGSRKRLHNGNVKRSLDEVEEHRSPSPSAEEVTRINTLGSASHRLDDVLKMAMNVLISPYNEGNPKMESNGTEAEDVKQTSSLQKAARTCHICGFEFESVKIRNTHVSNKHNKKLRLRSGPLRPKQYTSILQGYSTKQDFDNFWESLRSSLCVPEDEYNELNGSSFIECSDSGICEQRNDINMLNKGTEVNGITEYSQEGGLILENQENSFSETEHIGNQRKDEISTHEEEMTDMKSEVGDQSFSDVRCDLNMSDDSSNDSDNEFSKNHSQPNFKVLDNYNKVDYVQVTATSKNDSFDNDSKDDVEHIEDTDVQNGEDCARTRTFKQNIEIVYRNRIKQGITNKSSVCSESIMLNYEEGVEENLEDNRRESSDSCDEKTMSNVHMMSSQMETDSSDSIDGKDKLFTSNVQKVCKREEIDSCNINDGKDMTANVHKMSSQMEIVKTSPNSFHHIDEFELNSVKDDEEIQKENFYVGVLGEQGQDIGNSSLTEVIYDLTVSDSEDSSDTQVSPDIHMSYSPTKSSSSVRCDQEKVITYDLTISDSETSPNKEALPGIHKGNPGSSCDRENTCMEISLNTEALPGIHKGNPGSSCDRENTCMEESCFPENKYMVFDEDEELENIDDEQCSRTRTFLKQMEIIYGNGTKQRIIQQKLQNYYLYGEYVSVIDEGEVNSLIDGDGEQCSRSSVSQSSDCTQNILGFHDNLETEEQLPDCKQIISGIHHSPKTEEQLPDCKQIMPGIHHNPDSKDQSMEGRQEDESLQSNQTKVSSKSVSTPMPKDVADERIISKDDANLAATACAAYSVKPVFSDSSTKKSMTNLISSNSAVDVLKNSNSISVSDSQNIALPFSPDSESSRNSIISRRSLVIGEIGCINSPRTKNVHCSESSEHSVDLETSQPNNILHEKSEEGNKQSLKRNEKGVKNKIFSYSSSDNCESKLPQSSTKTLSKEQILRDKHWIISDAPCINPLDVKPLYQNNEEFKPEHIVICVEDCLLGIKTVGNDEDSARTEITPDCVEDSDGNSVMIIKEGSEDNCEDCIEDNVVKESTTCSESFLSKHVIDNQNSFVEEGGCSRTTPFKQKNRFMMEKIVNDKVMLLTNQSCARMLSYQNFKLVRESFKKLNDEFGHVVLSDSPSLHTMGEYASIDKENCDVSNDSMQQSDASITPSEKLNSSQLEHISTAEQLSLNTFCQRQLFLSPPKKRWKDYI